MTLPVRAVMERAEARRHASIMMSSSMRWSLTGGLVGCTRNTSHPRMLSSIRTYTCGDGGGGEAEGGSDGRLDQGKGCARDHHRWSGVVAGEVRCARLSVGEALDVDGPEVQSEVAADFVRKRRVGAAGKDAEAAPGVLLRGGLGWEGGRVG